MLKIALTGNIASGKSFVLNLFKQDGFKVLCLDEVVHDIYENDLDFKKKLIQIFKTDSRNEIAKIVFDNEILKFNLENLIYPKVKVVMNEFFIKNANENAVIIACPMLFESGFNKYFDKIIFISSEENLRRERLKQRNRMTDIEAQKRINAQDSEENKIAQSDFVIYNNGSLIELMRKYKIVKSMALK